MLDDELKLKQNKSSSSDVRWSTAYRLLRHIGEKEPRRFASEVDAKVVQADPVDEVVILDQM